MESPEKVDSMGDFLDPLTWDIWGIVLDRPVEMEDPPIVGSTFLWEGVILDCLGVEKVSWALPASVHEFTAPCSWL